MILFDIHIWNYIFKVGYKFDFTLIIHFLLPLIFIYPLIRWTGSVRQAVRVSIWGILMVELTDGLNWHTFPDCGFFGLADLAVGLLMLWIIRIAAVDKNLWYDEVRLQRVPEKEMEKLRKLWGIGRIKND